MSETTDPPVTISAIYLAIATSRGRKPQVPFTQRGITSFTQCALSEIIFKSVPSEKQLAYMGYKEHIEAFIAATLLKRKVLTTASAHPVGLTPWSVPLPLPPVIFQLAEKPSDEFLQRLKKSLEPLGLGTPNAGRGNPIFTIARPTINLLLKTLPAISRPQCLQIEGHCQLNSFLAIAPVYTAIDSFLATHTYEYKGSFNNSVVKTAESGDTISRLVEIRHGGSFFRDGYDNAKKQALEGKDFKPTAEKVSEDEPTDLTPYRYGNVNPVASIMVAKPSPLPSSINFGPSSQVPYKSGLLFPYFPGMNTADTKFLRQSICNLFLRNLGDEKTPPPVAFKELCTVIGPFGNTEAGKVMAHVLAGIQMALDGQCLVYLIFNDSIYRGFCLLGEKFSVYIHGSWHVPLGPKSLRASLSLVQSRKSGLDELHALLLKCKDSGGDSLLVERDQLDDMAYLADCLAKVDTDADDCPEDKIAEAIAACSLPSDYLTFRAENIVKALDSLLDPASPALYDKRPFYIPLKSWSALATREYKIFACFGPRSFTLRNQKGDEFRIPTKVTDVDVLADSKEKGAEKKKILIGESPIGECLSKWKEFLAKGSIRMDLVERAGDQRLHLFSGKQKDDIWDCLKKHASKGHITVASEKETGTKRSFEKAFGKSKLDSSFTFDL